MIQYRNRSSITLWALCSGLFALWPAALRAADEDLVVSSRWGWLTRPGHSVSLIDHEHADQVVWRFNYSTELTTPYFDPVAVPGGPSLSWNCPPDHAWHHGLWFNWMEINGVDYWQHAKGTDRPAGKTTWSNVAVELVPDGTATIRMDLAYAPDDAEVVLREERTVHVASPDATGRFAFDWSSRFVSAGGEAKLDRVPVPPHPQGVSWGGYAGLSLRFAKDFDQRQLMTSDGPVEFDREGVARFPGIAVDYSGKIGDGEYGVTMIDAPTNPRHPVTWYAIASGLSYLNPAILTHDSLTIAPRDSLSLTYRIIVHPGRWSAEQVREAAAEVTKQE